VRRERDAASGHQLSIELLNRRATRLGDGEVISNGVGQAWLVAGGKKTTAPELRAPSQT